MERLGCLVRGPSQANGNAFEQPWRTLGEVELDCVDPSRLQLTQAQVHSVLEQCIPIAMTGECMRADIETALFDALGRIDRGATQSKNLKRLWDDVDAQAEGADTAGAETRSACLRILVVASQAASALEGDVATGQDQYLGWSFFVIERPASASMDGDCNRKIIEVCLYHE